MIRYSFAFGCGFLASLLMLLPGPLFGQESVSTVKLSVVEKETGRPVTQFRFRYSVESADGEGTRETDDTPDAWEEVTAENGITTIPDMPETARVTLTVVAPGYMGRMNAEIHESFTIETDAATRQLRMELMPCVRVRGMVRDRETGNPIAAAKVSPIVQWGAPLFDRGPYRSRIVKTDVDGRFAVDVLCGDQFAIQHDAYRESGWHKADRHEYDGSDTWELTPKPREPVTGQVTAANSRKPLAGVRVLDPSGMEVKTDERGWFDIEVIQGGQLAFLLPGRVSTTRNVIEVGIKPLRVEMWPSCHFTVRATDDQDEPLPEYDLVIGPGRDPESYMCNRYKVRSADGLQSIALGEKAHEENAWGDSRFGEHRDEFTELWIGVRTVDGATAETWIDPEDPPEIVELRLRPGRDVVGRVESKDISAVDVTVTLEPMLPRDVERRYNYSDPSRRQTFLQREATPAADGSFRFAHVPVGQVYQVTIEVGPVQFQRLVPVVDGLKLVVLQPVRVPNYGTITGQISHPPGGPNSGPWEFASGRVSVSERLTGWGRGQSISFTTDREGRFTVKRVPAGWATVSVHFMMSADTGGVHTSLARVLPGQVTEVRMFDPSGEWNLPLEAKVGDGSRKAYRASREADDFRVYLSPVSPGPVSFDGHGFNSGKLACNPRKNTQSLHTVSPGRWRLQIDHIWEADGQPLFDEEVDVRPGMEPVLASLPACSIIGKAPNPIEDHWGTLFTTTSQQHELVRRTLCTLNEEGFTVALHPPGQFDLVIHDEDRWLQMTGIEVKVNKTTKLDVPAWSPGGTIQVRYTLHRPLPIDPKEQDARVTLVAIDSFGRRLDFQHDSVSAFEGLTSVPYTLGGLWPDTWSIELRSGGRTVAQADVRIRGTETVERLLECGL